MVVMRKDFMDKHPDVAKGYLRSELEAQRYLLDPKNWSSVIDMVSKHATGVPKRVLLVFDLRPGSLRLQEPVREWKSFYFNEREKQNIAEVAPFLLKDKRIKDVPKPGTVDDSLARQVFQEAGYTPVSATVTLGLSRARPPAPAPSRISPPRP